MAVFTQLLTKLRTWNEEPQEDSPRLSTREEHLSRALGKVEPYVVFLQSVLIWENPKQSVLFILALHGLFWFVVALELRFYFLLFGTALVILVQKMWVEKLWPEIRDPLPAEQVENEDWTPLHPGVLSAPELSHHLNNLVQFVHNHYLWLHNLRHDQPGMFCCLISTVFLSLMWIGWTVSGTTLLYCIFLSLLLGPGFFIHILPPDFLDSFHVASSKGNYNDSEEYLLEPTASELALLHQACEPNSLGGNEDDDEFNLSTADFQHAADDMTDSGAPSLMFIQGMSSMPAPEDLSLDTTDLSFELSQIENSPKNSSVTCSERNRNKEKSEKCLADADTPASDHDESASYHSDDSIQFQSRHFKSGSSSEEEPSFPKRYPEQNVNDVGRKFSSSGIIGDAAAAVLSYSSAGAFNLASLGAAVGQSLVSSVISSSSSKPTAPSEPASVPAVSSLKEDDEIFSDTDDFEMISEEEFANL